MRYQRARVVKHPDYVVPDNFVGRELWVVCGPPRDMLSREEGTGRITRERLLITNVRLRPWDAALSNPAQQTYTMPIELLELLPEFCDEPPLEEYA